MYINIFKVPYDLEYPIGIVAREKKRVDDGFLPCCGSGSGLKLVSDLDPVSDPDSNPDSNPNSKSGSESWIRI